MVSNAIKYKWKPENRGTKRKTTDIEDRRIVRYSKVYPFASSRDIKSELNLGISDVTIRRRLLNQNLSARSPRKVALISPRRRNWPVSKCRNILWTDGSKIVLFGGTSSLQYICRLPNTEYHPKHPLMTFDLWYYRAKRICKYS